MAKINGIVLLHKRYTTADWANHVLQAGELGLDLTTKEVRIGTASDQAWANASPVSCKVVVTGEGKHITSVTYENGVVTVTKGTISYDDLANKPALNFDAAGTAASAVSAHNSAADAHADIRQLVSDNATAISTEAGRAAGEEQRIEGLVTAEAARAAKAEGDLQTAVNAKVAQADYDTKVAALEKADTDLDAAVKAEAKTRGEEITRVEGLINTEKGRINTLEQTTIPGINNKIKANEDAIKALEGLATSGLSRQVVTELPSVDSALENVIYMILREDNEGAENGDIYDEYLLMGSEGNKRFELLGNTAVDLTNYYTKDEVYTKTEADEEFLNYERAKDYFYDETEVDAFVKEYRDGNQLLWDKADELSITANNAYTYADEAYMVGYGAQNSVDELRTQTVEPLVTEVQDMQLTLSETSGVAGQAYDQAQLNLSSINLLEQNTVAKDTYESDKQALEGEINNRVDFDTYDDFTKEVSGQISVLQEANGALDNRITELEKIEYTGDGMVEVSGTTISHKKSDTTTSADFGFFAFKVDEYGHITGIQAITTLDGNA